MFDSFTFLSLLHLVLTFEPCHAINAINLTKYSPELLPYEGRRKKLFQFLEQYLYYCNFIHKRLLFGRMIIIVRSMVI